MTTWLPSTFGNFAFSDVETGRMQALDDIMGLTDPPVRVNPDGTLTETDDRAPESFASDGSDDETDIIEPAKRAGWDVLTGYSGQHTYNGPVMHASEYIGGGLARDILAEPGVYAVATVDDYDGESFGWLVLRKR